MLSGLIVTECHFKSPQQCCTYPVGLQTKYLKHTPRLLQALHNAGEQGAAASLLPSFTFFRLTEEAQQQMKHQHTYPMKGSPNSQNLFRPYCCIYCNKRFKRRDHLRDHERLHTGERPFKCPHCGKGFAQRTNMNMHSYKCNQLQDGSSNTLDNNNLEETNG